MELAQIKPNELFTQCSESFWASLSDHDKKLFKKYNSPQHMMLDLRAHLNAVKKPSLDRYSGKVAYFSDRLGPYFKIIETFVSSNPDIAALLWGSVLLALKNLSLVYADILEFCRQILVMLSHGYKGSRWKQRISFFGDVVWRPFNARFQELLERLRRHKAIFVEEMKLDSYETLHDIRQSQRRLEVHYEGMQRALYKSLIKVDQDVEVNTREQFKRDCGLQINKLKCWVHAENYTQIYEHSKRNRAPDSGRWFLDMESYLTWRNSPVSATSFESKPQETTTSNGLLIVHAKPGFGKTYLSTTVIDDIESYVSGLAGDEIRSPLLLFYHFGRDSSRLAESPIGDALKAMAAQTIHQCREDSAMLDVVTLFVGSQSTGQLIASDEDCKGVLSMAAHHRLTYFVIDGLDECKEDESLIITLIDICQTNDHRLLLFSRSDISYPKKLLLRKPEFCFLNESHNRGDIRSYLCQYMEEMVEDGLFGNRSVADHTAYRAAQQSSGIFLWAKLYVSYLATPGLTPRERHRFVTDALSFEGLDGLYKAVLTRVSQRSTQAKKTCLKVFKWIAAALYPISCAALHTALAIAPGEETSDLDYLVDFPGCLPKITGALVDVDPHGRPAFIHLSVREFLISHRSAVVPEFSLRDGKQVHTEIAIACLSYLTHDIPKRPLRPLIQHQEGYGNPPEIASIAPHTPQATQATQAMQTAQTAQLNCLFHRKYWSLGCACCFNILDMHYNNTCCLPPGLPQPFRAEINDAYRRPREAPPDDDYHTVEEGYPTSRHTKMLYTAPKEKDLGMDQSDGVTMVHNAHTDASGDRNLSDLSGWKSRVDFCTPLSVSRDRSYTGPPLNNAEYTSAITSTSVQDLGQSMGIRHTSHYDLAQDYSQLHADNIQEIMPVDHTQEVRSEQSAEAVEETVQAQEESHVCASYPMLRYASLCWIQHIWWCLEPTHREYAIQKEEARVLLRQQKVQGQPNGILPEYIAHLSMFLLSRASVTNWVESSFAFQLRPSVERLRAALESVAAQFDQKSPETRELHWVHNGLTQLDEALLGLEDEHCDVLKKNPSLIWQDWITAATDPHYWPVWTVDDTTHPRDLDAELWNTESFGLGNMTSINNVVGRLALEMGHLPPARRI
ncbi:hypothetical protein GGR57DRAFT_497469 [Xylariaceae sp. FL1272]|nr:hypothetical protein GGR57DRAFT_497469 [Xylariaceae sp. FL1272]